MKERCVSCGNQTTVDTNTPVCYRDNYIDGAGQLCPSCFKRLYGFEKPQLKRNIWGDYDI